MLVIFVFVILVFFKVDCIWLRWDFFRVIFFCNWVSFNCLLGIFLYFNCNFCLVLIVVCNCCCNCFFWVFKVIRVFVNCCFVGFKEVLILICFICFNGVVILLFFKIFAVCCCSCCFVICFCLCNLIMGGYFFVKFNNNLFNLFFIWYNFIWRFVIIGFVVSVWVI